MVSMKKTIPYGLQKLYHKNANRAHFMVLQL